jgi:hypothetical protein
MARIALSGCRRIGSTELPSREKQRTTSTELEVKRKATARGALRVCTARLHDGKRRAGVITGAAARGSACRQPPLP